MTGLCRTLKRLVVFRWRGRWRAFPYRCGSVRRRPVKQRLAHRPRRQLRR